LTYGYKGDNDENLKWYGKFQCKCWHDIM
jgi:hypothetical protein